MATITSALALRRATLAVFATGDTREGSPLVDTWRRLIADLDEEEAAQLPLAIASILDPLRSDPDKFELALDIITTFDLVEALPKIVTLASTEGDSDLTLRAALLASSPAVSSELRNRLILLGARVELNDHQRQSFAVRLNPAADAFGDLQTQMRNQLWPGLWSAPPPNVAPIAVVDELAGRAMDRWSVLGDLVEAGAVVRRLPAGLHSAPGPPWLNPRVPVIAWSARAFDRLRAAVPNYSPDAMYILDPSRPRPAVEQLIREVNLRLAGWRQLRSRTVLYVRRADENPLSRELYKLGAFDLKDMTFLSGCGQEQLRRLKDVLPARYPREKEPYWSLNQVIAGRSYRFLQLAAPHKRISKQVITSLVQFAGSDEPTRVGINSGGEILIEREGRFINWKTREVMNPPDALLDRVFEPFVVDRTVPDLVKPSAYTRVHPDLAGGTPTVLGKRVSARAIAAIAEQLIGSKDDLVERVHDVYPDLLAPSIPDAANLGRALLSATR